jgi:uncharacterized membrane protein
MKKQAFFNVVVFLWLCSLSVGILFLSFIVLHSNYKETMKELGLPSDIDKVLSNAMEDSALSPEVRKMMNDLLGSSSQAGFLPQSSPRKKSK